MNKLQKSKRNFSNSKAWKDKEDKRLWKCKELTIYKEPLSFEESYTDVRELTVDEAVSWCKDRVKQLNDYCHYVCTVYSMGLFYKKGGEWVLYEENN